MDVTCRCGTATDDHPPRDATATATATATEIEIEEIGTVIEEIGTEIEEIGTAGGAARKNLDVVAIGRVICRRHRPGLRTVRG